MAKTRQSSTGKAKKAEATKSKPARKSKSPSKKAKASPAKKDAKAKASSGGSVVSIEACKQVHFSYDVYFGIFVSYFVILTHTSHLHEHIIP